MQKQKKNEKKRGKKPLLFQGNNIKEITTTRSRLRQQREKPKMKARIETVKLEARIETVKYFF